MYWLVFVSPDPGYSLEEGNWVEKTPAAGWPVVYFLDGLLIWEGIAQGVVPPPMWVVLDGVGKQAELNQGEHTSKQWSPQSLF